MKRIILSILSLIVFIHVYAYTTGTIYTPNGSAIEVLYFSEMSSSDITYYDNYYSEAFPNATLVGSSSATYNCHSYAWNMTEGGPTCWLNQFTLSGGANLSKYWTDGSYIETTESNATKVFYYNSDHSAIVKASDRTKYISKWGSVPLMEHAPGYGPYDDMVNRKYYIRNTTIPDDPDPDPEVPEVIVGVLSPGYGDYLRNQEYEFFPSQEINYDGECTYVWTIYNEEDDIGSDAVALGKATLECDEYPNVAKITFLTSGLFTVTVEIYNENEEQLGVFTCQPYVL